MTTAIKTKRQRAKTSGELLEENRPFCYYVSPDEHEKGKGFRVLVVFEDQPGFFRTGGKGIEPWYWGPTFRDAEEACRRKNERLGLSDADALRIVCSSMFPPRQIPVGREEVRPQ